jgi:hypothetical protein
MKIKAFALGENLRTFTLLKSALLRDLLNKWRYPRNDESIFVNNNRILNFDVSLKNGDIVTIVFPLKAAAPPPIMKKFNRYIEYIGFRFYQKGKGDHEIWINEQGIKLTINPNKRDKRYVDWASVDALKKILNCSGGELIKRINNL